MMILTNPNLNLKHPNIKFKKLQKLQKTPKNFKKL
jgi:hypothetical protein